MKNRKNLAYFLISGVIICCVVISKKVNTGDSINIEQILTPTNSVYSEVENIEEDKIPEGSIIPAPKVKTFNSVDKMIVAGLKKGDMVKTLGYYKKGDGGGGQYEIIDDNTVACNSGLYIKTVNGLVAKLIVQDNTINVKQFGAYGDGVHDDSTVIEVAINSGVSKVFFTAGEYKCTSHIEFNTANLVIDGKQAVLFTDDDYSDEGIESFVYVQANNISISNLTLEARETCIKYGSQLRVQNCSDVEITCSKFSIPEIPNNRVRVHTNVDLYTGWSNVTIDACDFVNLTDGDAGGCIWIRDIFVKSCQNLKFTNNHLRKKSHDEILAVFRGNIQNVEILNNEFIIEESTNPSVMCLSFGSSKSNCIDNITFTGNNVKAVSAMNIILFTRVSNVLVSNNNFNYKKVTSASSYAFYNNEDQRGTLSNVRLESNTINIEETDKFISAVFKVEASIKKNTVNINSDTNTVFSHYCGDVEDNIIVVNRKLNSLVETPKKFVNNEISLNAKVDAIFLFFKTSLVQRSVITDNKIKYNVSSDLSKNTIVLYLQQAKLSDFSIQLLRNTVISNEQPSNSILCRAELKDSNAQLIEIKDNTLGHFDKVVQYSNLAEHEILRKNNE